MRLKYMAEVLLAEFKLRMAKTPFTDQYCKCSLILDRGLCLHSVVRREFFAETNSHDLLCNWFVHQPDELDLVKIAIEPKLRGIGCGSLLYDVVCDTARACGIYRVRMIAGGHAKTEHADKSREAYLIRRGWSRKNGVMYKDVGDRGYVTKLEYRWRLEALHDCNGDRPASCNWKTIADAEWCQHRR
jgi:GNAT superfamily N-acetyltransferase